MYAQLDMFIPKDHRAHNSGSLFPDPFTSRFQFPEGVREFHRYRAGFMCPTVPPIVEGIVFVPQASIVIDAWQGAREIPVGRRVRAAGMTE